MQDKRPPAKPRKHPELWQSYIWWKELSKAITAGTNRATSIERGKSNLNAVYEWAMVAELQKSKKTMELDMRHFGQQVGPIFNWLVSIRGIGEPSAAKILAQTDNIAKFDTISKYWRFAGYATYPYWVDVAGNVMAPRDGYQWIEAKAGLHITCSGCGWEMEYRGKTYYCDPCDWKISSQDKVPIWTVTKPKEGWRLVQMIDRQLETWTSPFNKILKSEVWLISSQFEKQGKSVYRDYYDKVKEADRKAHPERITVNGRVKYNDGHIRMRALRKVSKLFLSHVWLKWREFDGLPVSDPWLFKDGSHHNFIPPPEPPTQ